MPHRLQLFGAPTLVHAGGVLALPFERRSQLLVLLALRRSWVGRAELAALLWPEQADPAANLRKTVFRLQGPPWHGLIELQAGALRCEVPTDVAAFEAGMSGPHPESVLALRRGELLAGFDDDANEAWTRWLQFERDRLRSAWRGAALQTLAADRIEPGAGLELSARLLEADPLDEAALRAHLSVLARSGQTARARQVYAEFVGRLADELGLAPGAELRALRDTLGGAAAAPVQAAPPAPSGAGGDDGFIGRAVERRRIAELLTGDAGRLLCLVGPGGVGKTRLAQRALAELAPGFADGAAFVALEDVATVGELAARLARETGLTLRGRAEPLQQLIDGLRERRMLLVLDNFEQLAAQAPLLDGLLAACPGLRLIVTSRVRLGLAREQLLPLEGLPCPEAEDQDRVETFDAARLFVAAARRVEPALVPSAEAGAIVEICRQVEGLPLALELAAAWTRVLSCAAIAAELRAGTPEMLRAVDAAHPARHASMELVFDQSWRRLATSERDALARLSVFRGGFSAEAARAVTGAPLAVLSALSDKSLVRKDGARLALHPLVQQLAAVRLGDGPAHEATQAAHASHHLQWLAQLKSATDGGDRAALQAIDAEFENVRAAWQWSALNGPADALARSVVTLVNHCDHRGRFEEGLALLRPAVEAPPAQADPGLQALLLSKLSHFEYRLDRYAQAQASAERALALAARHGRDRATRQQATNVLAGCALRQGRLADARRHYQQTLALAPAEQHARHQAATLDHLALVEKTLGNFPQALRLATESLAQHRRIGDSAGVALCLNNLASHYLAQRDYGAAAVHLRESLALCERDGYVNTRGYVLANLIEVAIELGDLAGAQAHAQRALEVAQATGNRALLTWVQLQRARLAARRAEPGAARAALAEAAGLAHALGQPALWSGCLLAFAELLGAQGEAVCMRRVLAFASGHPGLPAPDREELRVRLLRLGEASDADAKWPPALDLDELLQRIVVEAELAHAPLIEQLRGVWTAGRSLGSSPGNPVSVD